MNSFNLSEWAIRHRSLVWYMLIVFICAGAWSYFRLGRNEDPSFTIKTMVVQAQWPGATVSDTLEEVTDRLEKKLQELPHLDYLRSYTTPGRTTILVTLKGDTPDSAIAEAWYQVRKKLGDIRPLLPQGVIGPGFNDEFGDTYGIIYAFTADGFTHRELRDYVEGIRSKLVVVPDVEKIDIFGAQDERFYIEFSVQQLAGLNVDRFALMQALRSQNAITSAGVVQTDTEKILVRVSGEFRTDEDLRSVNFAANDRLFRLSDLATVKRGYADPPQPMFRVNGTPAIGLGISMRDGGDMLTLGRSVDKAMAGILPDLPIGIEPKIVAEQPKIVSHAVGEFMRALGESIAIVLAVSFISLGLRAGMVVAFSIPLVLAIVFLAIDLAGFDLQRVSLGALIIALGLLVDDAMITVESMASRLEHGADRISAATFAYTSTAFPMLTGTLVTLVGFMPVAFARSTAGEYTFSLFVVVGIALIVSWFVAVVFSPLMGIAILSESAKHQGPEEPKPVLLRFRRLLSVAMRRRWLTIGLTLALFALSVGGLLLVPQQFFPASDRPELLVDLKLTQNASIYATEAAATRLDKMLKDDPDIDHWSTYIGRGAVRFYLPMYIQLPNDFVAQAVLVTKSLDARERVRARLEKALPNEFPDLIARAYPLELGPPIGWPVQYRVSGADPATVKDIAYKAAQVLASHPAARNINFDWIEAGKALRMKVDQDQARLLGVSSETLAQALNAVLSGVTITQVRDGIYLIDVVARAKEEDRISLATLRTLQVPLSNGRTAPLVQFASIEYSQELPLIWRRNRVPTLTVQSDVAPGAQAEAIVLALQPKIDELNASLPKDYSIAVGGTYEESMKSQRSVLAVVPVMLFLMFTFLMIQLQSFHRLFLVLSVAPLGVIGVAMALLVSGKPLGFVSLLGVLALIGMIIRNSVILVDQIETEIALGRSQWDAVVEASSSRFRPILLTAAAAILGMIPIAPTVFWGPMAYAIMGGLAVATVLTLLFLPALYVAWFRVAEPATIRA
jgi:multidrug efflux pump subunit AcrB